MKRAQEIKHVHAMDYLEIHNRVSSSEEFPQGIGEQVAVRSIQILQKKESYLERVRGVVWNAGSNKNKT